MNKDISIFDEYLAGSAPSGLSSPLTSGLTRDPSGNPIPASGLALEPSGVGALNATLLEDAYGLPGQLADTAIEVVEHQSIPEEVRGLGPNFWISPAESCGIFGIALVIWMVVRAHEHP